MPRPTWTPTPEQRRRIAAWLRAKRRRDAAIAQYLQQVAELVDEHDIQISHLIEVSGIERKRFYRELAAGRAAREPTIG